MITVNEMSEKCSIPDNNLADRYALAVVVVNGNNDSIIKSPSNEDTVAFLQLAVDDSDDLGRMAGQSVKPCSIHDIKDSDFSTGLADNHSFLIKVKLECSDVCLCHIRKYLVYVSGQSIPHFYSFARRCEEAHCGREEPAVDSHQVIHGGRVIVLVVLVHLDRSATEHQSQGFRNISKIQRVEFVFGL